MTLVVLVRGAPRRPRRSQTLPYAHEARPLATALAVGVGVEVCLLGGPAVADVAGAEVDGGGGCFGWRLRLRGGGRRPGRSMGMSAGG